jgi:hypothetical protein
MGKTTLIAETDAWQLSVALAMAAAYFVLKCEIHRERSPSPGSTQRIADANPWCDGGFSLAWFEGTEDSR